MAPWESELHPYLEDELFIKARVECLPVDLCLKLLLLIW